MKLQGSLGFDKEEFLDAKEIQFSEEAIKKIINSLVGKKITGKTKDNENKIIGSITKAQLTAQNIIIFEMDMNIELEMKLAKVLKEYNKNKREYHQRSKND